MGRKNSKRRRLHRAAFRKAASEKRATAKAARLALKNLAISKEQVDPQVLLRKKFTRYTDIGYVVGRSTRHAFHETVDGKSTPARWTDIQLALPDDDEFPEDMNIRRGIGDLLGLGWASVSDAIIKAQEKLKPDQRAVFIGIMAARARLRAGDALPFGARMNIEAAERAYFERYTKYPWDKARPGFEILSYNFMLHLMRAHNPGLPLGTQPELLMDALMLHPDLNKMLFVDKMIADQDLLEMGFDDVNAFAHLISRHMRLTQEQQAAFDLLLLIKLKAGPVNGTDVTKKLEDAPKDKEIPKATKRKRDSKIKQIEATEVARRVGADYEVDNPELDKVSDIETLVDMGDAKQKRLVFDQVNAEYVKSTQRMALRLLEKLKGRGRVVLTRDLEDGLLDSGRLTRLITDPALREIFYESAEAPVMDTAVTLLLDNSGSMSGDKIKLAYLSARMISGVLTRCGVPHEILGYTTYGSRDSEAGELKGRGDHLQHVIYKSFREFAVSPDKLAAMLGMKLSFNVDGEALLWAANRLLARSERRRILIPISDGIPAFAYGSEDGTKRHVRLGTMPRDHLLAVARTIEARGDIELAAIGIKHDVSQFYTRSVTIDRPGTLAQALNGLLELLILETSRHPDRRPFRKLQAQLNARRLLPGQKAELA